MRATVKQFLLSKITVKPPTGGRIGRYQSAVQSACGRVVKSVEDIVSAVTVKRSTQSLGDGL